MRGRALGAAWCVASTAVGAILGAGGAGLGTRAGREAVVRAALATANSRLHGALDVGSVGGSWIRGLDAHDVVLKDSAGFPVVRIGDVGMRYRLRDLLGGRITLGELSLDSALVDLRELPDGRLNIAAILGNGSAGPASGRQPLIAFRDVAIRHANVVIRTRLAPGDSAPEEEAAPLGRYRVRRIADVSAALPYVRLMSPLPRDAGIRIDIAALSGRTNDPALDVRGARGTVTTRNDTIALDLDDARLPHSSARVRGTLLAAAQGLGLDLTIQATTGASDDVRGLAPRLPRGVDGHGRFTVHQRPGGALTFTGDPIALTGRGNGGSADGTLGVVIGPGDDWAFRDTRLNLDRFDLEYVRPLLDTLPVAGRVSGTVRLAGDRRALTADLDVRFQDSLVAGRPVSTVQGGGLIHLGVPGDLVFERFAVRSAHVALGTVRRLLPSVHLLGAVDAAGTLDGAWRTAQFSGTMRHRDGSRPPTLARGVVRIDGRRDTVGVWADLQVDSLDLDGIASELRGLPVHGAFAGDVKLAGYADSLVAQVDLSGPAGSVAGGGTFTVVPPHVAVRDLDVSVKQFDLHAIRPDWIRSRINGRLTGDAAADTLRAPSADLVSTLSASEVSGAPLDSARGSVLLRDSVVNLDSLRVWGPGGLDVDVRGRLAEAGAGAAGDSLLVRANTDSLALVAPLLAGLGVVADVPDSIDGGLSGVASVHGSAALPDVRGTAGASTVRWGAVTLRGLRLLGQWPRSTGKPLTVYAEARTILAGRFVFARPSLTIDGTRDSLRWRARSGLGDDASAAGAGRWQTTPQGSVVSFDSLAVLLPDQRWALDPAATLAIEDSAVLLSRVALRPTSGGGSIAVSGRHPRIGSGDVRVALNGVPLTDVWAVWQRDPREAGGTISGTIQLTGALRTPAITAGLALRDGRFGDFQAPYAEATASYHDQRLGAQLGLFRSGAKIADFGVDLPLDLALADVPRRELPGPLAVYGRTDSLDLGFVEALTPSLRATTGRMRADVGIRGSWDKPELTGFVDVEDASATLPSLGVTYRAISGHLSLSGDTVRVDQARAESDDGGASVRGTLRFASLTRPELDLSVFAQNFHALNIRNFLDLSGSGELELHGPVFGAHLTGRATVTRGVLYFADLINKDVLNVDQLASELGDTAITATVERQGLGPEFSSRFLDSLRIDTLALTMGSDVWLRSAEANIALTGQVTAGKVGKAYRIDGTLETPRGTYRLPLGLALGPAGRITRDFTVTRGRVQYFGTSDLNAVLDVDAQHVVRTSHGENVTVFVNIGGTLYVPKLTLSSDVRPAISETEIMSYLLVGAPNLGAVQGGAGDRVLSEAVGILSGQLESALMAELPMQLDYLSIRTGDVASGFSGTEIAVGTRVLDKVYLTLSPRLCPGQQVLTNVGGSLEYRISPEWRFAASRDPVRGCDLLAGQLTPVSYQFGLDLFWEKSY